MKALRWPESGLTAGDADHIVNLDLLTRQQIDDLRRVHQETFVTEDDGEKGERINDGMARREEE